MGIGYRDGLVSSGEVELSPVGPLRQPGREVRGEAGLVVSVPQLSVVDDIPSRLAIPVGIRFVFDTEPIDSAHLPASKRDHRRLLVGSLDPASSPATPKLCNIASMRPFGRKHRQLNRPEP
jgi:hypothetical protein